MMNPNLELVDRLDKVIDLIQSNGWARNVYVNKYGEHCLVGAWNEVVWGTAQRGSSSTFPRGLFDKVVENGPVTEWNDEEAAGKW